MHPGSAAHARDVEAVSSTMLAAERALPSSLQTSRDHQDHGLGIKRTLETPQFEDLVETLTPPTTTCRESRGKTGETTVSGELARLCGMPSRSPGALGPGALSCCRGGQIPNSSQPYAEVLEPLSDRRHATPTAPPICDEPARLHFGGTKGASLTWARNLSSVFLAKTACNESGSVSGSRRPRGTPV